MLTLNTHTAFSDNFLTLFRRPFALLAMLTLLPVISAAQNDKDTPILEPGKPIERELAGDAAHSYRITLTTNQFLYVVVEQKGIDVVIALFAPDGKKVAEVDSPNGTQGPEPISVVAEAAGNYRLEVRSPEAKAQSGRYQVKVEELRTAKPQDMSRIAAHQRFAEAEQLFSQGNANSRRKAIDKFQESLPLWRDANDSAKEAETLNYIGGAYQALGEFQSAVDYFNQALQLSRNVGDHDMEATTLNNIGGVYTWHALADIPKSIKYFNQALPLWRKVGNRYGEAATLINIGSIQWSVGEQQKSLDLYLQALPIMREIGDREGEGAALNGIGLAYWSLGEYQKSLDSYGQALSIARAIRNQRHEAVLLGGIGRTYMIMGERQKALEFYKQALPLIRATGDRREEANILASIGVALGNLGDTQGALDHLGQSLTLFRSIGSRHGEANTLSLLGKAYNLSKEADKALDYYRKALDLKREHGDLRGQVEALHGIAQLKREAGNLTESLINIEAALTIIESLRTKIGSQELRSSYFATIQKYYEFYIDLVMQLHKQKPSEGYDGKALQASERGRARSLLEILAEANADIRQGVDSKLLESERALQQQLNAKAQQQTRLLSGSHSKEQAEAIAKEIDVLTTEFQQTAAQIRQTSPRYAALTQPQPLSAQEIQAQVLDADTLLLEYALGDEKSYLWAVTPTSITSYELPKRAEIEDAARQFYASLTARRQGETIGAPGKRELGPALRQQAEEKSAEVASGLSRMLLGPVAGQLGEKRLLIVGDGALQYIPFGALPAPSIGGEKMGGAQPLVVKHEIVNLPSASTLAVLRREARDRQPATKTVVVLADPVFEGTDQRIKKRAAQTASNDNGASPNAEEGRGLGLVLAKTAKESGVASDTLRIPRLPGTRREAEQIIKLVPAAQRKQAFDFAASRHTATDPELGQYRYVHFATHGFLNSQHPELSGLMFTMFDEEGHAQDGFLRAHEVFNLKLSAEVVVLSACQTGLGKEVRGEGLVGLTRGFMYAGAPRVVVSLWSVSDAATAELMTRFYRGMLVEKLRPAKALQAAQVSMLKDKRYASPFYWAAFTLQGEWR